MLTNVILLIRNALASSQRIVQRYEASHRHAISNIRDWSIQPFTPEPCTTSDEMHLASLWSVCLLCHQQHYWYGNWLLRPIQLRWMGSCRAPPVCWLSLLTVRLCDSFLGVPICTPSPYGFYLSVRSVRMQHSTNWAIPNNEPQIGRGFCRGTWSLAFRLLDSA